MWSPATLKSMNAPKKKPSAKIPKTKKTRRAPVEALAVQVRRSGLQDWVMDLGLRQQGVLLSAVRGCDTAPKNDPSKNMTRVYRGYIMNTTSSAPASFIEYIEVTEFMKRAKEFLYSLDQYPHHFIMHFVHAAEIIGYCHPQEHVRTIWMQFYDDACYKMHMHPESKEEMDLRLNADESTFKKQQMTPSERKEEEFKTKQQQAAWRGGT